MGGRGGLHRRRVYLLAMENIKYTRLLQAGFTIVELLIVIVVIAILASISIVAYTGIQARANDAALQGDTDVLKKAMELYYIDKGSYPICAGGSGSSCTLASLKPQLAPSYVSDLPDSTVHPYYYVGTNSAPHGDRWSVRIFKKSTSAHCQVGVNYYVTWWSSSPPC